MTYLQVENLSKSYGNKTLFENISFVINKKDKCALIAKNGAGKTTLLNIITGNDIADSGKSGLNKDISTAYLIQEPVFEGSKTVIDQVFESSDKISKIIKDYEQAMLSEDESMIQKAVETMDREDAWDFEREIKLILTKLKITDFEKKVSVLSGGQRKRLALANVLLSKPDFIILDEPTNHLDFEMIEWLEEYLAKSEITVFLVTHDRYFLDKVCNVILEIDDNQIFRYKGNYLHYLKKRTERIEITNANIEKAKNLLIKESKWMNRQPQARATKAKSRIDNFYKIKEDANKKIDTQAVSIDVEGKRLGKKLIDIYNIKKSYDKLNLVNDFSYKFVKGEKIGIFGNNGVGKSTFLNILTNKVQPDSGYLETGETVSVGFFEQSSVNNLDENKHLIEVIKDIAEVISLGKNHEISAGQFAEYFLFPRSMHYNYVSQLSGGEKRRLYLMTVLMKNPNFLILDEPTNDLDIMTLNVLEDYLRKFKGTVIIVSHDRYFLDKVAETLFIFEGNGIIKNFPGNYSAYNHYLINKEKEKKREKSAENKISSNKKHTEKKQKLTYKERFEFEQLESELKTLGNEKNNIEEYINTGNFEDNKLAEKSKRLIFIKELIDDKEMRWLELSENL
ncbi:MAG: ABC-F family ATP-binding cassette domain-containing protein [Bacteroidales bacterium]|nr:ABC-F family ATP-binding cassette domain-containing protein [Bacteroidales bacterium]